MGTPLLRSDPPAAPPAGEGRSSRSIGRQRISTGNNRPDTSITGASSKCFEKRSASMVAEVMTSRRSLRFCTSVFR